jgi:hypothetical protein
MSFGDFYGSGVMQDPLLYQQMLRSQIGTQGFFPGLSGMHALRHPSFPATFSRFEADYNRGYYQQSDQRGFLSMIGASLGSLALNQTPLAVNNMNFQRNLENYRNTIAYSRGRLELMQRQAWAMMNRFAAQAARQRGVVYDREQQEKLRNAVLGPVGQIGLVGAQTLLGDELLENAFGVRGSGAGMYDAAYNQATYFTEPGGIPWSPEARSQYAARAASMLYLDPEALRQRKLNSLEGGRLYNALTARGLLGSFSEDVSSLRPADVREAGIRYLETARPDAVRSEILRQSQKRILAAREINLLSDRISQTQQSLRRETDPVRIGEKTREIYQLQETRTQLEQDHGLTPRIISYRGSLDELDSTLRSLSLASPTGPPPESLRNNAARLLRETGFEPSGGTDLDLTDPRNVENLSAFVGRTRQRLEEISRLSGAASQDEVQTERERIEPVVSRLAEQLRAGGSDKLRYLENRLRERNGLEAAGRQEEAERMDSEIQDRLAEIAKESSEPAWSGPEGRLAAERVRLEYQSRPEAIEEAEHRILFRERQRRTSEDRHRLYGETAADAERVGLRSSGALHADTEAIPVDAMVSESDLYQEAIRNPELERAIRNEAKLKAASRRYTDYEKAIKALQESMTEHSKSMEELVDAMTGFAGGNLSSMDPLRLRRNVRQTYALARQLGQGDEYVAGVLGQSTEVMRALRLEEGYVPYLTQQTILDRTAATRHPVDAGVRGSRPAEETAAVRSMERANFLESDDSNTAGVLLRMREKGQLQAGSAAETYLNRLLAGQRVEALSPVQVREMILSSVKPGQGWETHLERMLSDRRSNQASLLDHQEMLSEITDSMQEARILQNTSYSLGMELAASGPVRPVLQKLIETRPDLDAGRLSVSFSNQFQSSAKRAMERFLDSEERNRIAAERQISPRDFDRNERVFTYLLQEEIRRTAGTAEAGSLDQLSATAAADFLASDEGHTLVAQTVPLTFERTLGNVQGVLQRFDRGTKEERRQFERAAERQSLMDEAASIVLPASLVARGAELIGGGASPSQLLSGILNLYDTGPDSEVMRIYKETETNLDHLTAVQERIREVSATPVSATFTAERKREILSGLQEELETARQKHFDNANRFRTAIDPLVERFTKQEEAALANQLGHDVSLLKQVTNVPDETGRIRIKAARPSDLRINETTGLVEAHEGNGVWGLKRDALYAGEVTTKDKDGKEITTYRKLSGNAQEGWTYRDESGRAAAYTGEIMTGTQRLVRDRDGLVNTPYVYLNDAWYFRDAETEQLHLLVDEQGVAVYGSKADEVLRGPQLDAETSEGFTKRLREQGIKEDATARFSEEDNRKIEQLRMLERQAERKTLAETPEERWNRLANSQVKGTTGLRSVKVRAASNASGESFPVIDRGSREEDERNAWNLYQTQLRELSPLVGEYFREGNIDILLGAGIDVRDMPVRRKYWQELTDEKAKDASIAEVAGMKAKEASAKQLGREAAAPFNNLGRTRLTDEQFQLLQGDLTSRTKPILDGRKELNYDQLLRLDAAMQEIESDSYQPKDRRDAAAEAREMLQPVLKNSLAVRERELKLQEAREAAGLVLDSAPAEGYRTDRAGTFAEGTARTPPKDPESGTVPIQGSLDFTDTITKEITVPPESSVPEETPSGTAPVSSSDPMSAFNRAVSQSSSFLDIFREGQGQSSFPQKPAERLPWMIPSTREVLRERLSLPFYRTLERLSQGVSPEADPLESGSAPFSRSGNIPITPEGEPTYKSQSCTLQADRVQFSVDSMTVEGGVVSVTGTGESRGSRPGSPLVI